jgi:hypothetical protein
MKLKLVLALGLAAAAAGFASSLPDGLERVASELGFLERGRESTALLAGYALPGLEGSKLAGAFAGVFGVLLLFAGFRGVAFILRRFLRLGKSGSEPSRRAEPGPTVPGEN